MKTKHIIFKIILGALLLFYGAIFIAYTTDNYTLYHSVFSNISTLCAIFIILIIAYYISVALFFIYLNKNKSDKWILLPMGILSLFITILTAIHIGGIETGFNDFLFGLIILVLILVVNLFTMFCVAYNYKYKVTNYIVSTIGILLSVYIFTGAYDDITFLLLGFILLGMIVNLLYLSLSKKGYGDFIDSNKVYQDLLKAKNLLDQDIITNEEYEAIRVKYVKYL